MAVAVGSTLPDVELLTWTGTAVERESAKTLVATGKTMVVGVVGAFTPVCSGSHLPEYVPLIPTLKESGLIHRFICVGVVDPFVMHAWGEHLDALELIEMWSDADAEFAKAIGITADFSEAGLGLRGGRFSMVVNNGVIEMLNVEDDPSIVSVSGAEEMERQLVA
ncbi:MAG: redoxin family protein [Magnetovibrionaceae bacterium]